MNYKYYNLSHKKINKSISIIYNYEVCDFFLQGIGTRSFPILNFRRELENNGLVTTFISGQTSVTPEGYFWVRIEENKEGINFQVIQSSVTYVVEKVEKFSENGKVVGRVSFNNYEELLKRKRYYDSLSIQSEKEKREMLFLFSIFLFLFAILSCIHSFIHTQDFRVCR